MPERRIEIELPSWSATTDDVIGVLAQARELVAAATPEDQGPPRFEVRLKRPGRTDTYDETANGLAEDLLDDTRGITELTCTASTGGARPALKAAVTIRRRPTIIAGVSLVVDGSDGAAVDRASGLLHDRLLRHRRRRGWIGTALFTTFVTGTLASLSSWWSANDGSSTRKAIGLTFYALAGCAWLLHRYAPPVDIRPSGGPTPADRVTSGGRWVLAAFLASLVALGVERLVGLVAA
jgi:hypothetical protein